MKLMTEDRVPDRLATGIRGLDDVLKGGFFQGGTYLLIGHPGTGKTILANQLCFHHVTSGRHAVYVTLLVESHARMLQYLSALKFFQADVIGSGLKYYSGYRALEEGPENLLKMLQEILVSEKPDLLIIDGLSSVEEVCERPLQFKRFVHDLQVATAALNCTTFLVTVLDETRSHAEFGIVDGIVKLAQPAVSLLSIRQLEIQKLRGGPYLQGKHEFRISDEGMEVYPRTESLLTTRVAVPQGDRHRLSFANRSLDQLLAGGILSGSTSLVLGASGAGKTLLGLSFLAAGARAGEHGVHFGFYESPQRVVATADQVGMPFSDFVNRKLIEIIWKLPVERILDRLAQELLNAVRRNSTRRLFIDGLSAFEQAASHPERLAKFFTALTNELRALNVTTIISAEIRTLFGPQIEGPALGISAAVENIILLRYVELGSRLYRLISVLKARESGYDSEIREFKISSKGIEVASTFESAQAILTGVAQPFAGAHVGEER